MKEKGMKEGGSTEGICVHLSLERWERALISKAKSIFLCKRGSEAKFYASVVEFIVLPEEFFFFCWRKRASIRTNNNDSE